MGLGDKSLAQRLEEVKKEGLTGVPLEELLESFHRRRQGDRFPQSAGASARVWPGRVDSALRHQAGQHADRRQRNSSLRLRTRAGDRAGRAGDGRDRRRHASLLRPGTPEEPAERSHRSILAGHFLLRASNRASCRSPRTKRCTRTSWASWISGSSARVSKRAEASGPFGAGPAICDGRRVPHGAAGGDARWLGFRIAVRVRSQIRPTPSGGECQSSTINSRRRGTRSPTISSCDCLGRGGYGEVWEAKGPGGMRLRLKIVRNLEGTKASKNTARST